MKERKAKVQMVDSHLSKRARAFLLTVNLSSCYVKPKSYTEDVVTIMNEMREIYERHPFKGYRRITRDLQDMGYVINHKKVYRLMKLMSIEAIYPKKNLSKRRHKDVVYPYLLKVFPPSKPHDVWCVDITYIKIANGFIYLTALIDVVSRCVMGYNVSTSLDTESCLMALEMAIKTGYKPKIINSDQGCQFTSQEWIYNLALLGIKVSMDGKGRCLDNIPIERLWRTIKYEEVYLKTYDSVNEAKQSLAAYIHWYNTQRRHSGINHHKPYEVMTCEKEARTWSFKEPDEYVDNSKQLPHKFTAPPTETIKQQKVKLIINHSSRKAA
jgi:putative transposase